MNTPLRFSEAFITELVRERQKLNYMINSANPFAHPMEFSQEEVLQMKHSYNAIIKLLFLAGHLDEISYQQDLYACPELV